MASIFRLGCVSLFLMGASLGCGGGGPAAAPVPAAIPAPPPPPPPSAPPPPPSAVAGGQAVGTDVPVWAGQRQDEPFDVKQYLASRAAPADNAAPLYMTALAPISGELGNGSGQALAKEIGELADVEKLAAGTIPQAQVDQVLAKAASALQQIDAAQSKPKCVFVTGLTVDALLPHAQAARSLARLSVIQIHRGRATGDFDLVEAAAKRGLRMSRDLQPRGHVVCQLVSIAIDATQLSAIERMTLNDPRLTPEQCDRLLTVLDVHQKQMLNRAEEGLKVEYITSRNCIHDIQTGRLTPEQVVELVGTGGQGSPSQLPQFNYEAEIAAYNRLFPILLEGAKNPSAQIQISDRFRDEIAKLQADAKAAAPTTRQTGKSDVPVLVLILLPSIDAFGQANLRSAAQLAGTQMLIALRRYELAHGQLPPTLDAAAAETILRTVPTDPYAGAPLKYTIVAGKPTIYSIGKDLKDDGGQADWKFGTQPGDYLFVLAPRAATN